MKGNEFVGKGEEEGKVLVFTNAEHPQEIQEIRFHFDFKPLDEVLDVTFVDSVDNGMVVMEEIPEHLCSADIVPNLGLEKGDVPGNVVGVLLATSNEVLASHCCCYCCRLFACFVCSGRGRDYRCQNLVGGLAKLLEPGDFFHFVHVNTTWVEPFHLAEPFRLTKGDLEKVDQHVDHTKVSKQVLSIL